MFIVNHRDEADARCFALGPHEHTHAAREGHADRDSDAAAWQVATGLSMREGPYARAVTFGWPELSLIPLRIRRQPKVDRTGQKLAGRPVIAGRQFSASRKRLLILPGLLVRPASGGDCRPDWWCPFPRPVQEAPRGAERQLASAARTVGGRIVAGPRCHRADTSLRYGRGRLNGRQHDGQVPHHDRRR